MTSLNHCSINWFWPFQEYTTNKISYRLFWKLINNTNCIQKTHNTIFLVWGLPHYLLFSAWENKTSRCCWYVHVCMFISVWRCVECQKVSVPYSSSSSHRSSHITLNCLLILLYSIFRITPSSSLDNMFHSSHQHAKLSKNIFHIKNCGTRQS